MRFHRWLEAPLLPLLAVSGSLFGQNTASITRTVKDPTGASILGPRSQSAT
jgi:hypothetical protein